MMRRATVIFLGATSLLVASAGVGRAVEDPRPADAAAAPAAQPTSFLQKAAMGGLAEVELGKLAQQNASSAEVKRFASQMVTDHGKANQEIQTLAKKEGLELPTRLDAKHQALRERLEKLQGAEFDRAYMAEMVADHTKDVDEFDQAAKASTDPQVKEFASRTLPTLEAHLKMARDIQKSL
jgi:putative membrane protein